MNSSPFNRTKSSLRVTVVAVLAAVLACVLASPFGTQGLAFPTRVLFWSALIGFNALKWRLWHFYVPSLLPDSFGGQVAFSVGGAVLLNAMLPFEIDFLFRAVGHPMDLPFLGLFLMAFAISLAISAVVAVVLSIQPEAPQPPAPPNPIKPATILPTGLGARADLASIHAVVAEDHYLRLHMADGRQQLVLYRFGDAIREMAAIDGHQVHRGAWVAAAASAKPVREGRKWRLQLGDGTMLPVSETHVPTLRARGWLS